MNTIFLCSGRTSYVNENDKQNAATVNKLFVSEKCFIFMYIMLVTLTG